jgi:hypothetical protein
MSDAKKPAPRKAQRGLGRGLSALIGDAAAPKVAGQSRNTGFHTE